MIVSMNGILIEEEKAVVSIYDHGFLYGIGLFETFRTYLGQPFLLDRHLARLLAGCEELNIAWTPEEAVIRRQAARLLEVNGLQDAYFRLTVSAGIDVLGLPSAAYEAPNVILYVKPLPARSDALYRDGKELRLLERRRNTPEGSVRLKSFHYMNNILAKRELQSVSTASNAEGLMLTEGGYAAEGIVSNVFFVREGRLFTPSLDTGILPGVTRAFVLELAARQGLQTEEGWYRWEELLTADEAFITNSIQEIVPVTRLADTEGQIYMLGNGHPGQITRRLIDFYIKEANLDDGTKTK